MVRPNTAFTHEPAAGTPMRDSETVLGLLHRLTAELSSLFRQEVALASAEVSRSMAALVLSLASVGIGGAAVYAGFLLLLLAAVLGLAYVVPTWLAAALVGFAVASVGCALLVVSRNKLKSADLLPSHSARSLRRDKEVLTRSES